MKSIKTLVTTCILAEFMLCPTVDDPEALGTGLGNPHVVVDVAQPRVLKDQLFNVSNSFLLLVVRPGAPSSVVAMPGAPSSVLAPSSRARSCS